jgi:hypothetical protein
MTGIRILGLPAAAADVVRRTRRDAHGNIDLVPKVIDEPHSAPCRVCLSDLAVGEEGLLFGHTPFGAPHPYRTLGPIWVHLAACTPHDGVAVDAAAVPEALRRRLLSVRAHDANGRMLDCDVTPGEGLFALAQRLLEDPRAQELHVHHARPGCFACRIVRA